MRGIFWYEVIDTLIFQLLRCQGMSIKANVKVAFPAFLPVNQLRLRSPGPFLFTENLAFARQDLLGPLLREMDEQVLACLQATLSPQEGIRQNAESQLKQLFLHPGELTMKARIFVETHLKIEEGGLSLSRILSSERVPVPQRQISFGLISLQLL